jgi:hypothetical protein
MTAALTTLVLFHVLVLGGGLAIGFVTAPGGWYAAGVAGPITRSAPSGLGQALHAGTRAGRARAALAPSRWRGSRALAAMVGLMVEEMGQNVGAPLLKRLALRGGVGMQPLQCRLIREGHISDDALIFIGAGGGLLSPVIENDDITPVVVQIVSGQPPHPIAAEL